jgi:hypothetical protein
MRAAHVCLSSLVLCCLGVRLLPHRALGAPPPRRRAWRRPRYPQENLVRACASCCSPEISRGGHGILPTGGGEPADFAVQVQG